MRTYCHTAAVLEIRPTTEADWQRSRTVRLAALADSPLAFVSTYDSEAGQPDHVWRQRAASDGQFLAWDGEDVVGLAVGLRSPDLAADERRLVAMWVAPAYRSRGIAGRLCRAVAGWARADGATALVLEVVTDNEAAQRAYRAAGFAATGHVQPVPGDGPPRREAVMRWSFG